MELSDFGRRHRGIVVSLAALPVLAGAAGTGLAAARPAEYRHSVDVQIPAPSANSTAAALDQNVSTYRSLVGSGRVAAAVARETGVRASEISDGLATQRPQQGTQRGALVRVTYTGTDRAAAPAVGRAAAAIAVSELMRPAIDATGRTVADARAAADSSRRALAAASERNGALPVEEYRSLQAQIAQLEAERDAPSGNRSAADVRKAIAVRKKRLSALAPLVVEAQALLDRLTQANRALADAQRGARDAQARLDSARASVTPVSPVARPVARTPIILRTTALSAGVGVLLAIGILPFVVYRRPRPVSEAAPVPERSTQPIEL